MHLFDLRNILNEALFKAVLLVARDNSNIDNIIIIIETFQLGCY